MVHSKCDMMVFNKNMIKLQNKMPRFCKSKNKNKNKRKVQLYMLEVDRYFKHTKYISQIKYQLQLQTKQPSHQN